MQIDLTPIIVALIGLLSTICTCCVVPLIKSKLTADQWARLQNVINVAVAAAEQLSKTGIITKDARKEYVLNAVNDSGILDAMKKRGITVDISQIYDMLEASVYTLPNKITTNEVRKITEQKVEVMAQSAIEKKVETVIVPSVVEAVKAAATEAVDNKLNAAAEEAIAEFSEDEKSSDEDEEDEKHDST